MPYIVTVERHRIAVSAIIHQGYFEGFVHVTSPDGAVAEFTTPVTGRHTSKAEAEDAAEQIGRAHVLEAIRQHAVE